MKTSVLPNCLEWMGAGVGVGPRSWGPKAPELPLTTRLLRIILGLTAVAILACQSTIDGSLQAGWEWLRVQPFFKHDSFEPIIATLAFFPPLISFYLLDMYSCTTKGRWLTTYQYVCHVVNSTFPPGPR